MPCIAVLKSSGSNEILGLLADLGVFGGGIVPRCRRGGRCSKSTGGSAIPGKLPKLLMLLLAEFAKWVQLFDLCVIPGHPLGERAVSARVNAIVSPEEKHRRVKKCPMLQKCPIGAGQSISDQNRQKSISSARNPT